MYIMLGTCGAFGWLTLAALKWQAGEMAFAVANAVVGLVLWGTGIGFQVFLASKSAQDDAEMERW